MPSGERYPDAPRPDVVKRGEEFEDLVTLLFAKYLSMPVSVYQSRRDQLTRGESPQRIECKRDQPDRESGRYAIEMAEKSDRGVKGWTPSGIYRRDNTIFYVTGGPFRPIFVFAKSTLRRWRSAKDPKWHEFNGTKRSFYLSQEDAKRLALFWFEPSPWRLVQPPAEDAPVEVLATSSLAVASMPTIDEWTAQLNSEDAGVDWGNGK